MFSKYHYLNNNLHRASDCYVMFIGDNICGFFSLLQVVGHTKHKNFHRVVILPEYQGLGLSQIGLSYLSKKYTSEGYTVGIVTSAPSMIHQLNKNKSWKLTRASRDSPHIIRRIIGSSNRYTTSFQYMK